MGFVPNLLGVMAEAPPLLEAYLTLTGILEKTSLTPAERQLVLLTVSRTNDCHYCIPAHIFLAEKAGLAPEAIAAIRDGRTIGDPRLEALRRLTEGLVQGRGRVAPEEVGAFLAAGFSRAQVLEVVLGVGLKTLSNYTNHLAETPIDAPFQKYAAAEVR
jgi:AhpD family alkylhydroperoxidase